MSRVVNQRIPGTDCPACARPLSAVTGIHGAGAPQEGDTTLCAHCGTILVFNRDLSHRLASREEIAQLPADAYAAILKARRSLGLSG